MIASHDDQPDDPEAAADRSGNPTGAERFPEPYTDRDLRAQIIQSLSGLESDYDVDGILTDYQTRWQLTPFDALDGAGERIVPALEYWAMVANHTLIDDHGKPKHSADCDGWLPDAECNDDCPCNKPATVFEAADTAAAMLGLEVLTVVDARRGITGDGRRLVTIRLVDNDDPALQANGPSTSTPAKGVPGPF